MPFTRRTFLFRISAGAATLGALVTAPRILGMHSTADTVAAAATGAPVTSADAVASEPTSAGRVVAYVRDAARGEVAIYAGMREVILHDRALVSHILQSL